MCMCARAGVEHCGGCSFEWEIGVDWTSSLHHIGWFSTHAYPIDLFGVLFAFIKKFENMELNTHSKPAIRTNHTPSTPSTILRAKHSNHPRNLIIIPRSPPRILRILHKPLLINPRPRFLQRRTLYERFQMFLKRLARRPIHIRSHRTGVYHINSSAFRELARPCSCHGFQSCFGATVYCLPHETETGGYRGEIHDAAGAVGGEVG